MAPPPGGGAHSLRTSGLKIENAYKVYCQYKKAFYNSIRVDAGLLGFNPVWSCRKIQTFRRWRQYVPPKRRSVDPLGVTTQMTNILTYTAMRTSDLTVYLSVVPFINENNS
jgi:hypothetical protein